MNCHHIDRWPLLLRPFQSSRQSLPTDIPASAMKVFCMLCTVLLGLSTTIVSAEKIEQQVGKLFAGRSPEKGAEQLEGRDDPIATCYGAPQCNAVAGTADLEWSTQFQCPSVFVYRAATFCPTCGSAQGCENIKLARCIEWNANGCLHPM